MLVAVWFLHTGVRSVETVLFAAFHTFFQLVDALGDGFKNSEVSNAACEYLKCSAHKHTWGLEKCTQTTQYLFRETWAQTVF